MRTQPPTPDPRGCCEQALLRQRRGQDGPRLCISNQLPGQASAPSSGGSRGPGAARGLLPRAWLPAGGPQATQHTHAAARAAARRTVAAGRGGNPRPAPPGGGQPGAQSPLFRLSLTRGPGGLREGQGGNRGGGEDRPPRPRPPGTQRAQWEERDGGRRDRTAGAEADRYPLLPAQRGAQERGYYDYKSWQN